MLLVAWSILKIIIWLFVIPFFIGVLFNGVLPVVRRTIGITFILGYMVYFAVFEVIAIPCMLHYVYNAFSYCTKYYLIAVLILTILGMFRCLQVVSLQDAWKK